LALQRLLAPAIVLPVIVRVLLSSLFIGAGLKKKLPGFPGSFRIFFFLDYILLPVHPLMAMRIKRAIINSDVWFIVSFLIGKNRHYFKKTRGSTKKIKVLNLGYTY
jgi:uncharacterized membrane protein YphA (DoxX/SURF4 family)